MHIRTYLYEKTMDAKLTLKLDKSVINKAKKYASSHNKSLSGIIESYLRFLVEKTPKPDDSFEISPFVRSMQTGVQIPADLDYKKVYGDHLSKKFK